MKLTTFIETLFADFQVNRDSAEWVWESIEEIKKETKTRLKLPEYKKKHKPIRITPMKDVVPLYQRGQQMSTLSSQKQEQKPAQKVSLTRNQEHSQSIRGVEQPQQVEQQELTTVSISSIINSNQQQSTQQTISIRDLINNQ